MYKLPIFLVVFLASFSVSADRRDIVDLPSDHVIVFGEMHGTREVPVFVGDQIETLLNAGHAVRIGLELSSDDTDALNAAMLLPDDALHAALMNLPQWRTNNDARNGIAMASMLQRFGRLAGQHPGRLTVFAFDIPHGSFTSANARDAHMADVIDQHRTLAGEDEYLLVLVGNAHAFIAPGAPWDPDFRSMATQLMSRHPVISLRNAQSGGQAWLCMPDCKVSPLAAMDERENGIYLEPIESAWADGMVYHGAFFYGRGSVSKPLPVWLEQQTAAPD